VSLIPPPLAEPAPTPSQLSPFQRLEDEVSPDQRAYVRKIVQRLTSCRVPNAGYARYVCPGCQYERYVPFSCKTRFCPSCSKVRVANWVNDIARVALEAVRLQAPLFNREPMVQSFQHLDWRERIKAALVTTPSNVPTVRVL
jgi:hypothetical protein